MFPNFLSLFLALLAADQIYLQNVRFNLENQPNEDENSPISKADETEDLIAELCVHAPSENIKSCLRQYQYGKTILSLQKDFSKFLREDLDATAKFLRIKCPLEKLVKADLFAIPKICYLTLARSVAKRYIVDLAEDALVECAIFHRECWIQLASLNNSELVTDILTPPSFKTIYNPMNISGMFYICKPCEEISISQKREKRKSALKKNQRTLFFKSSLIL